MLPQSGEGRSEGHTAQGSGDRRESSRDGAAPGGGAARWVWTTSRPRVKGWEWGGQGCTPQRPAVGGAT